MFVGFRGGLKYASGINSNSKSIFICGCGLVSVGILGTNYVVTILPSPKSIQGIRAPRESICMGVGIKGSMFGSQTKTCAKVSGPRPLADAVNGYTMTYIYVMYDFVGKYSTRSHLLRSLKAV